MANPDQNSIHYYRERELRELALANISASPAIKNIHIEMADSYRKMVLELEGSGSSQAHAAHITLSPMR